MHVNAQDRTTLSAWSQGCDSPEDSYGLHESKAMELPLTPNALFVLKEYVLLATLLHCCSRRDKLTVHGPPV